MRRSNQYLLLACMLTLAGCARPAVQTIAPGQEIYLENALVDVVRSLAAARRASLEESARQGGSPIGFDPCSAQVVFNVKAMESQTNTADAKLTLAAPVNVVQLGTEVGASQTNLAAGERGNVVTLLMTSPACVPANSLGANHPTQIAQAAQQIRKARADWPPLLAVSAGKLVAGSPSSHQARAAGRGVKPRAVLSWTLANLAG